MSYTIVVSAQQLTIIEAALQLAPAMSITDELGYNVKEMLTELVSKTLRTPEDDDMLHGFII